MAKTWLLLVAEEIADWNVFSESDVTCIDDDDIEVDATYRTFDYGREQTVYIELSQTGIHLVHGAVCQTVINEDWKNAGDVDECVDQADDIFDGVSELNCEYARRMVGRAV